MFPRIVDLISRDQSVITMKNIIAETSILFCSHSSEAVIYILMYALIVVGQHNETAPLSVYVSCYYYQGSLMMSK